MAGHGAWLAVYSEKTKLDISYELSARADNSYKMPSSIFSEKYQEKIKMSAEVGISHLLVKVTVLGFYFSF